MASQNPTNLLVIPSTWTWSAMFPFNLVFSIWFSIRNLKLRYLILDVKILTLKKSVDPSQRNDTQKLILVDLVEVDEVEELLQRLTMRDLKKRKNYYSLILIDRSSLLTYFTLALAIKLILFLMWSQITFLLSIRRTGSQQIDF